MAEATTSPVPVVMTTGMRIRYLMEIQGRKPEEFAATLGVGYMTLWRWRYDVRKDRGKNAGAPPDIPSNALKRMADELETTTDFLLCRTPDPAPIGDTRMFPDGEVLLPEMGDRPSAYEDPLFGVLSRVGAGPINEVDGPTPLALHAARLPSHASRRRAPLRRAA